MKALMVFLLLFASPAAEPEVAMTGVRFVPHDVVVHVGGTVTWVHRDSSLNHHVVADDGSFDSNPTCGHPGGVCMKGGDRYSHTFLQPGTVRYYCRLHGSPGGGGMAGTVKVEG
jgi:plastocyanin